MQPSPPARTRPAPVSRPAPPDVPAVTPPSPETRIRLEVPGADLYLLKKQTAASAPVEHAMTPETEALVAEAGADIVRQNGGVVASPRELRLKRAFDVLGALGALLVFAPVFVVAALWIRFTSPGPIFFYQERLGRNGRWFRALKFRTMYADAEARLHEMLAADPALRVEYQKYHKLAQDPRVTRAGLFLRRHSLDELPQLFNVLRGEMSLVGPRAYMPFEVPDMSDTERILQILQVKPGLTGFWQVGGRNNVSFDERLDMDVFYVQHWSLGMDLYILVNTAWLMLFARGYGAA